MKVVLLRLSSAGSCWLVGEAVAVASLEVWAWPVGAVVVVAAVARDLSSQPASASVYWAEVWDEAELEVEAEA